MNKFIAYPCIILFIPVLFFIYGCDTYGNEEIGKGAFATSANKENFRHSSLTEFSVDSFLNNQSIINYVKVDSSTKRKIFPSSRHGDTIFEDPFINADVYYYSWQPNNRNQVEFTLLAKLESPVSDLSSVQIRYIALDSTGKMLYNFIAAKKENRIGLHFTKYNGRFINDSVYRKTNVGTGATEEYTLRNNHTIAYR